MARVVDNVLPGFRNECDRGIRGGRARLRTCLQLSHEGSGWNCDYLATVRLRASRETATEPRGCVAGLFNRRDSILLVFAVGAVSEENLFENLAAKAVFELELYAAFSIRVPIADVVGQLPNLFKFIFNSAFAEDEARQFL